LVFTGAFVKSHKKAHKYSLHSARIRVRLNRVRLGNLGDCKAVGEGVMEFRLDFGPGYRVYFGQAGDILVILLCGGDKRTQSRDIATAKQYWQSYKRRTS